MPHTSPLLLLLQASEAPKKAAVVIIGCGNLDGSDCIEAVSMNIALSASSITPTYFAPSDEIPNSYNYHTREIDSSEERFYRKEAARITRKPVQDIVNLKAADFDTLILVGGSGWSRNISNVETEAKFDVCVGFFVFIVKKN